MFVSISEDLSCLKEPNSPEPAVAVPDPAAAAAAAASATALPAPVDFPEAGPGVDPKSRCSLRFQPLGSPSI